MLLINIFSMCACYSSKMRDYYSDKNNFIKASGTIDHIKYSDDDIALHLGFSDLTPKFDDDAFKIVGDNVKIIKENKIDEKIEIGTNVEFITAPKYWGDGYVMPIVAITVDGEELLGFDEGYANFMTWYEETH